MQYMYLIFPSLEIMNIKNASEHQQTYFRKPLMPHHNLVSYQQVQNNAGLLYPNPILDFNTKFL